MYSLQQEMVIRIKNGRIFRTLIWDQQKKVKWINIIKAIIAIVFINITCRIFTEKIYNLAIIFLER